MDTVIDTPSRKFAKKGTLTLIGSSPASTRIFSVRGRKVILDSDLAELYGVPTKRLNEQVRRNPRRFPEDFAFLLTSDEWESLRSQIATLENRRGRRRRLLARATPVIPF